MEKQSFETYVDEDAMPMYVEPPAVAGGQTENGEIGMDAEIEVDEEEVFIYHEFCSKIFVKFSPPEGGNSIRKIP